MDAITPQAGFVTRSRCINCGSEKLSPLSSGRYTDEPLHGFLASDPWGESPLPYLQKAIWQLVKCEDCSQVFHFYMLNDEWNERRFSKWMSADAIAEFSARFGSSNREWDRERHHVEHILRIRELVNGPVRLLDFGCGFGSFVAACRRFGFDAIGLDRAAPRREESEVPIFESLDEIPDRMFDVVTLFEVLEHVDTPTAILTMLRDRVVAGGLLVLETPNCEGVTGIDSMRDYRDAHPLEHINCFTFETLKSIAERAGFRHIARPPAFVTASVHGAAKTIAKTAIGKGERSTQLYFRRV